MSVFVRKVAKKEELPVLLPVTFTAVSSFSKELE
jgi:hypothetical protein